jgi:hypothetical protein
LNSFLYFLLDKYFMDNKFKFLIAGGVGLVLLIALAVGGFFVVSNLNNSASGDGDGTDSAAETQESQDAQTEESQTEESSASSEDTAENTDESSQAGSSQDDVVGEFYNYLKEGSNQQCSWSSEIDGQQYSGRIYISDGQFRQEIDPIADQEQVTNSIYKEERVYLWTGGTAQGYYTSVGSVENLEDDFNSAEENPDSSLNQAFGDIDESFNIDCEGWNPDPSLFQLPNNVVFTDLDQLQNQFQQ